MLKNDIKAKGHHTLKKSVNNEKTRLIINIQTSDVGQQYTKKNVIQLITLENDVIKTRLTTGHDIGYQQQIIMNTIYIYII